jgi:hypothetical protein
LLIVERALGSHCAVFEGYPDNAANGRARYRSINKKIASRAMRSWEPDHDLISLFAHDVFGKAASILPRMMLKWLEQSAMDPWPGRPGAPSETKGFMELTAVDPAQFV